MYCSTECSYANVKMCKEFTSLDRYIITTVLCINLTHHIHNVNVTNAYKCNFEQFYSLL